MSGSPGAPGAPEPREPQEPWEPQTMNWNFAEQQGLHKNPAGSNCENRDQDQKHEDITDRMDQISK